MGNELFGVDIAGIIADVMGEGLLPVTIVRDVRGARTSGSLTGGRASAVERVECIGFWEDINPNSVPPGIELELNDRKLVLIGDLVPPGGFPRRNDACTVHEAGGDVTLYCVQALSRDPAAAVFGFLCRDRGSQTAFAPVPVDPAASVWEKEDW
jgi:hypothetical protein